MCLPPLAEETIFFFFRSTNKSRFKRVSASLCARYEEKKSLQMHKACFRCSARMSPKRSGETNIKLRLEEALIVGQATDMEAACSKDGAAWAAEASLRRDG